MDFSRVSLLMFIQITVDHSQFWPVCFHPNHNSITHHLCLIFQAALKDLKSGEAFKAKARSKFLREVVLLSLLSICCSWVEKIFPVLSDSWISTRAASHKGVSVNGFPNSCNCYWSILFTNFTTANKLFMQAFQFLFGYFYLFSFKGFDIFIIPLPGIQVCPHIATLRIDFSFPV